jgi:hypothetical protein
VIDDVPVIAAGIGAGRSTGCGPYQQVRQLGDVGGDAPGLVAVKPSAAAWLKSRPIGTQRHSFSQEARRMLGLLKSTLLSLV